MFFLFPLPLGGPDLSAYLYTRIVYTSLPFYLLMSSVQSFTMFNEIRTEISWPLLGLSLGLCISFK